MANESALYLRYRPKTLDEIVGNRDAVEALAAVLADKANIPHAILLTGPSGCGKTTIARIIKDRLRCADVDFKELDAASDRSIEGIREIRRQMQLKPIAGDCKVWLLDEVHALGTGGASAANAAQNALLKALEDTPKHVYFILATTDPQKLLPTIRNRCMTFTVRPLSERLLSKLINDVVKKEGKQISEKVVQLIARESLGSPRAALVMLQKVIDLEERQQLRMIERIAVEESRTIDLCRALMDKNSSWKRIKEILKGLQGQEPENIRRAVLGYCSQAMLNGEEPALSLAWTVIDTFKYNFYDSGFAGLVYCCYNVVERIKHSK